MVKTFFVENYQSIKDALHVSFVASSLTDETSYCNYFRLRDNDILKVLSFYGMNASGKSTITRALAALREIIVQVFVPGPLMVIRQSLPYFPFKFSDETRNGPTSFGIEFSLNNNEGSPIYRFNVSFDSKRIIEEKLEKLTSQKYSLLYLRKTDKSNLTTIEFGSNASNQPLLEALKSSVVPDKSFLSLFSSFRVEDIYDAYMFFAERMINISPEVTRFDDIMPDRIERDAGLRNFLIKLLKAADFNIDDFHVSKTKQKTINVPGMITERKTLLLDHNVPHEDRSIEFIQESLGTKKIIILGTHLYDAISKPSVLIIDELEASLHPDLTRLIVTLFLDDTINVNNSQLIFTSHESTLLDLNLLRRDQINFVYKDKRTCGTYVRSLKDFSMRKDSVISKSYLAGRFDTSPEINEYALIED